MRNLRSRLILSHILPLLVVLPVIGVLLVYLVETQFLLANSVNDLQRQAVLVAQVASSFPEIWLDNSRAQEFVTLISPRTNTKVMLLDPAGRLLVSSDPNDSSRIGQEVDSENIRRLKAGDTSAQFEYNESGLPDVIIPVVSRYRQLYGFVKLANPLSEVYARSMQLRLFMIGVVGGGLLLGIFLGLLLATDLERPLKRVTQAVTLLAESGQTTAIEEKGPREVRQLVKAVNYLVDRLKMLEQNRRRLLANLVHELGTPLGALYSGTQALLRGAANDPALRQELLEGMASEMMRLRSLLNDLAHLNDQATGSLELNLQTINLNEWLPGVVSAWKLAAEDKGLQWTMRLDDHLPALSIDLDRMAQAVGNLVSNAIRYTPRGGKIGIQVSADNGKVLITVEDSGPGISKDEQEKIFLPFFRGKAARRFSEGMGLGLSISRDLVQAHAGDILLESSAGKGSRFIIELPYAGHQDKER